MKPSTIGGTPGRVRFPDRFRSPSCHFAQRFPGSTVFMPRPSPPRSSVSQAPMSEGSAAGNGADYERPAHSSARSSAMPYASSAATL